MFESRSVQVHPAHEQLTITKHEMFGWALQSTQEINSKESHLETDVMGVLNSVTTTENYVKLFFKRDRDMPGYSEIVRIESNYWGNYFASLTIPDKFPSNGLVKYWSVFWGFVAIVGKLFGENSYPFFVGLLLAAAPYLLHYFLVYRRGMADAENAAEQCEKIEEELKRINV